MKSLFFYAIFLVLLGSGIHASNTMKVDIDPPGTVVKPKPGGPG